MLSDYVVMLNLGYPVDNMDLILPGPGGPIAFGKLPLWGLHLLLSW